MQLIRMSRTNSAWHTHTLHVRNMGGVHLNKTLSLAELRICYYTQHEHPNSHAMCPFMFFPTLPCGVLVFLLHLLAPPPSSFLLLLSHKSSLTQHHSHNITHTTSLTQHLSQQHLSQQHLTHNITHTTSHTQHLAHNITHTTSLTTTSHTQHHSHNIPHTTSRTQHHSHNISNNTTSHTQHLRPVPFACCVRRLLLAKGSDVRPGVVWRRLGTGALPVLAVCGACCLPRGRMYALASSGVGWAPALCR